MPEPDRMYRWVFSAAQAADFRVDVNKTRLWMVGRTRKAKLQNMQLLDYVLSNVLGEVVHRQLSFHGYQPFFKFFSIVLTFLLPKCWL